MNTETETEPLTTEQTMQVLKFLLTGYELLEHLDAIQFTDLYRHQVKQKVKALIPELEKIVKNLDPLFDKNEEVSQALLQYKKELMQKIAGIRPDDQSLLNGVLDQFFRAPELTAHRLGVLINK